MVGDVGGKKVLDLCCGEGHLARMLADRDAFVTGVDLSEVNLGAARRAGGVMANPDFVADDAQSLATQTGQSFDIVVCKMALMDIPDVDAVFAAVHRVLRPRGRFLAALLHPCFETPFRVPHSSIECDEEGRFKSRRVQRYFDEGLWHSGGDGVRGHVGAHHRKLSTYVNSLLNNSFQLVRLEEPQLSAGESNSLEAEQNRHIPRLLFFEAARTDN